MAQHATAIYSISRVIGTSETMPAQCCGTLKAPADVPLPRLCSVRRRVSAASPKVRFWGGYVEVRADADARFFASSAHWCGALSGALLPVPSICPCLHCALVMAESHRSLSCTCLLIYCGMDIAYAESQGWWHGKAVMRVQWPGTT